MSLVTETIRLDPRVRQATILRGGDISFQDGDVGFNSGYIGFQGESIITYMVAEETGLDAGRRRLDPFFDFETAVKLPPDCGILPGDLIKTGDTYFLVMSLEDKWLMEQRGYYKGLLYRCNSVISIYYFNSTTGKYDTLHKSGIHCLITQVRARAMNEDKAYIVSGYQGKTQPFQIFAQSVSGIKSGCVLIDQDNRRFRISKDFDPFITDSILQTQCMWEN